MALDEVTVTPLDSERFRNVLVPDALARFEPTRSSAGASCSRAC